VGRHIAQYTPWVGRHIAQYTPYVHTYVHPGYTAPTVHPGYTSPTVHPGYTTIVHTPGIPPLYTPPGIPPLYTCHTRVIPTVIHLSHPGYTSGLGRKRDDVAHTLSRLWEKEGQCGAYSPSVFGERGTMWCKQVYFLPVLCSF